MPNQVKQNRKGLTSNTLTQLQNFIEDVKSGKIIPFEEKAQKANQNLKKSGLIK